MREGVARQVAVFTFVLLGLGCGPSRPDSAQDLVNVAAAANLTKVLPVIGEAFAAQTGLRVVPTFGATAYLAHQIASGAPFDVYAAADVEHVDGLIDGGHLLRESRAVYAHGRLVLWSSSASGTRTKALDALRSDNVKFIAVAKPEIAPYGKAAVQALRSLGLWDALQPKIVYAQSVVVAKQFVDSGNADSAFIAASLLGGGDLARGVEIDAGLHDPIEQALGIVARSTKRQQAQRFVEFLLGPRGQAILARFNYASPL